MKPTKNDSFESISTDDLETVAGGRLIASKGPSAAVLQGIQDLVKLIGEVGQTMAASGQAQSQQMMGLMQQMMEKRKAGG